VAAWGRVLDDVSDATLHIVGAGHPEAYGNKDGIEVHGYVENLTDVFRRCALYVQPSRIDTFPVSTLEAMATGLPTAVTNKTGTLSEVQKVDPSLIMAPNPSTVGQTISKYFRTSVSRRRTLSEQFRDIGSRFAETSQRQEFKRNFEEILEEIHSE
jgi:glycosyltransferase involved in cell wall biosynthesis